MLVMMLVMMLLFQILGSDYKLHSLQELKSHWRALKSKTFREINTEGQDRNKNKKVKHKFKALGYEHMMRCFRPAWEIAFNLTLVTVLRLKRPTYVLNPEIAS